ncbi:MAG: non-hydrolyzing UDP-N-acetylglucosamine 2-epimerase [Fusobacteriaceae bacterium]
MKIGIIFGTRPEVIKIAPVYYYFKEKGEEVTLISTGQHDLMLDEALNVFKLIPNIKLKIERKDSSLEELTIELVKKISEVIKNNEFDVVLVQGDTTTAFIGALIAFYNHIPVGHIEAGLRTDNIYGPFPEEVNRRLIGQIASFHFAPTEKACENLLKNGVKKSRIILTGNTVVDAIYLNKEINKLELDKIATNQKLKEQKYIILTMHRRESIPEGVISALTGIKMFCKKYPEVKVVYPVHLNKKLREITVMKKKLWEGIEFIEPLNYKELAAYVKNSLFVMTDSGGIQEEAPSYNKYTLILREETERQEIVSEGIGVLVGTDSEKIFNEMEKLYLTKDKHKEMKNPYGNGDASKKIYEAITKLYAKK